MNRRNKELNVNKIFACQQLLSEVSSDLIQSKDTLELGKLLSKLNNNELDEIRKKLKEEL